MIAAVALEPGEPALRVSTGQEALELAQDVAGEAEALVRERGFELPQPLVYDLVEEVVGRTADLE